MSEHSRQPGALKEQFIVRFPDGLRSKVKAIAAGNRRSMNAELLLLIEKGMAAASIEYSQNAKAAL
jgi:hypothetical protein